MPDKRTEEREERHKANADGWYDAWRGWAPAPTLLNDEKYADDYMEGYREKPW